MNILQDFDNIKFQYHRENLHDVFGTVLDTYPHITGATVTGQVYLWDALQKIKYNLVYDIDPRTYLINKYVNNERNVAYDQRKEQLPAVCYNARYNGHKDTAHLKSITNLMFLDIDDFPSREIALEYKESIIIKYDWIVACNLSLSKLGLHIIALVDKIYDNKDFNKKYDFISEYYFKGRLDKSSKSLTRYTIVPYDYDIYINESPSVLNIDQIINVHKEGIRSAYIQNKGLTISSINEKGISSAYNRDYNSSISLSKVKGTSSVYNPPNPQEKIIYTPYTFSSDSSLEHVMNDAARKHNLKFRMDVDEANFEDPNIPIYIREGIDVIEVNTFKYKYRKVNEGHRHDFIGLYTLKMLLLNASSTENNHKDIRRDILKFIQYLNRTYCEPPMTYDEVIKSYNANWKRYKEGKIDFTNFYTKRRAFWSKQSTLTANEKRSVTCKIKNAPIVEESKRRICEAIETLNATGQKITQTQVALISGLSISTVKNYKKEFHEYKKVLNAKTDILEIDGNITCSSEEPDAKQTKDDLADLNSPIHNLENDFFELDETIKIENANTETIRVSCSTGNNSHIEYSENQLELLYLRIFESLHSKLDENKKQRLHAGFLSCFQQLTPDDKKLLSTPNKDIHDGDTFWKQSTIERNVWNMCIEIISE
ncbi:MAG: hypothetical protein KA807_14170 [Prolixibacteraceae bacterium]|nr:hypothetical protein [Prolixibacteraceae bacterium]